MDTPNITPIFENKEIGYIQQKPSNTITNVKQRLVDIIENLISTEKKQEVNDILNDEFLKLDFGAQFDVDINKVGLCDASFFVNLLNPNNSINYSINDNQLSVIVDNKKVEITPSLLNVLNNSIDTKKPIRLDFDKDITVILKMDRDGKIQTHFIPGTLEVESYLKQNLGALKQRFDEEEINYSYLGYSKYKQQEQNQEKKGEK